jgi:hypothetical protein
MAGCENNAGTISQASFVVGEISAAVGAEPLAAAATGVASITAGIAAGKAAAEGNTLGAVLNGLGAVLGGTHLVSDVADHWATNQVIVKAFDAESEAAFNKSLSAFERVQSINRAAKTLDKGYGTAGLAWDLHSSVEKWAEHNLSQCVSLEWGSQH